MLALALTAGRLLSRRLQRSAVAPAVVQVERQVTRAGQEVVRRRVTVPLGRVRQGHLARVTTEVVRTTVNVVVVVAVLAGQGRRTL